MIAREHIQIRDPFVLPSRGDKRYYLYGTTDKEPWLAPGTGFDVYYSSDLKNWEGPFEAFRPPQNFWSDKNFWAPEVHRFKDRFYMFASFKTDGLCRGTQILVSDGPLGSFAPYSNGPITPQDWECLDGTLFIDDSGNPWMVFCHEWTQIGDGRICAMPLSRELDSSIGQPIELFTASQSPWTKMKMGEVGHKDSNGFITDGPFMYRAKNGDLLMLWSSFAEGGGYALGIARSRSGDIQGPWAHDPEQLYSRDGGHGMLFKTFDGQLMLTVHSPNTTPDEKPVFLPVTEEEGYLSIKKNNDIL